MTQKSPPNWFELTADLVSAYVSHNALPPSDLPSLIDAVHAALRRAGRGAVGQAPEAPRAPVPIKKSITPDYLISLEDGRPYRSLTGLGHRLCKSRCRPAAYADGRGC
jgi:MucR family transcriptional regulator, transcriptional regulator of exopolysaccharide biosynthesis